MPTTARKTTASLTDSAVEKALEDYKKKVAEQVQHYMDTGDLCEDEARNIRDALNLQQHLDLQDPYELRLAWSDDFVVEYSREYGSAEHSPGGRMWVRDQIAKAVGVKFGALLHDGVTVVLPDGETGTIKAIAAQPYMDEYTLEPND